MTTTDESDENRFSATTSGPPWKLLGQRRGLLAVRGGILYIADEQNHAGSPKSGKGEEIFDYAGFRREA